MFHHTGAKNRSHQWVVPDDGNCPLLLTIWLFYTNVNYWPLIEYLVEAFKKTVNDPIGFIPINKRLTTTPSACRITGINVVCDKDTFSCWTTELNLIFFISIIVCPVI